MSNTEKNAELRSSLLYFADEAIGYRHSLHFFHRWLETGNQQELHGLILEVGREHFEDLGPLLASIENPDDNFGFAKITEIVSLKGIYIPKEWTGNKEVHIGSILPTDLQNPNLNELLAWQSRNAHLLDNCLSVIQEAHNVLHESRTNFFKVFNLLEMLFGLNTIFSCVINNDIKLLGKTLGQYYPKQADHLTRLSSAVANNLNLNWKDALSRNQVKSKLWLIEKLTQANVVPKSRSITDVETSTLVVGGWVGMIPFLASMLGKNLDSVTNVDIDKSVHSAALELNTGTHYNFKNSGTDVREIDLKKYKKLLIIDTIVEHFKEHGEWVKTLPKGTTVILQGNDMFDVPDHVNCHKSLEEFLASCGLNTILWAGELNLYKCTRYMAIGKV
jgi:hypothetical protein